MKSPIETYALWFKICISFPLLTFIIIVCMTFQGRNKKNTIFTQKLWTGLRTKRPILMWICDIFLV